MMQSIRQLKSLMKGDPAAVVNQMLQKSPQGKEIMRLIQESGGDPKTAFYKLARDKGIDPDAFINSIKE